MGLSYRHSSVGVHHNTTTKGDTMDDEEIEDVEDYPDYPDDDSVYEAWRDKESDMLEDDLRILYDKWVNTKEKIGYYKNSHKQFLDHVEVTLKSLLITK